MVKHLVLWTRAGHFKADEMQDQVESLVTKLKYAYYITGGALDLAVVELILVLTGVI